MIASSKPNVNIIVSHKGKFAFQEKHAWTFSLKKKLEMMVLTKPIIIAS
jgi:hypothetical protein